MPSEIFSEPAGASSPEHDLIAGGQELTDPETYIRSRFGIPDDHDIVISPGAPGSFTVVLPLYPGEQPPRQHVRVDNYQEIGMLDIQHASFHVPSELRQTLGDVRQKLSWDVIDGIPPELQQSLAEAREQPGSKLRTTT